jgi:acyl-CoA synthetase (AMP-forming)/AMP-acid ligase II
VTVLRPEDQAARPDSVGRPFLGSRVAVLDEAGRPVPPGEVGLLCARTEYGFAGYYGQPELDAAVEHHGWRTAGDLARQDPEGYVYLVGRRDNMVVIRGENVYPEEVEQVLRGIPGVANAAVVPEPADAPTHLVALVRVQGAPPDAGDVLRACRQVLAPRKVPRRVIFVEELPTTPAGKVARGRLTDLLER